MLEWLVGGPGTGGRPKIMNQQGFFGYHGPLELGGDPVQDYSCLDFFINEIGTL